MTPHVDFSTLLDVFSELIVDKLSQRLSGPGREGSKMKKRLLTVEEAAHYLGRTKEALQHMIAAGKLPTVKADRRVFLDIKDLDLWIDGSKF